MSTSPSHDTVWPTSATASASASHAEPGQIVRAGLLGGLAGGVIIWIYEAIVWVGVQHLMPMAGIPRNATGLVFGKDVQEHLGALAYVSMTVVLSIRYIAPAARVSNAWDTKVGGTLADALTCNAVVKSFGAEAREDARLMRVIGRWRKRVNRTWLRYNYTNAVQLVVLLCLRGSVIGGALLLWMAGHATPGDVTYVLTSYYVIHAYLRDVGMHINNLQRSVNDMEELVAIHSEPIGIADAPDAKPIDIQGGRIVFDQVTFHYGGHPAPLYNGLSVDIRAGERVGLVGRSGSGKTTFVKLVQRLYDVSGGRILIDGQDIREVTQASLRNAIGMVPQDTVLFNDTVRYNVRYGRWDASDQEVEEAARLAQIDGFIRLMPKGYETEVGERGLKLSGGEKQRVAIARTILKSPPILLLDEATSALDSHTEKEIQDALERVSRNRTTLVIAHRLSTIIGADEIIVLDQGIIVERGTHHELLARGGLYASMWNRQREAEQARELLARVEEETVVAPNRNPPPAAEIIPIPADVVE